ncbi:MAG TPA: hypothetical protein VG897_16185, partial [Terriglobales bacterium]|nr:hypothetical protein [Terriglobales bacterium]
AEGGVRHDRRTWNEHGLLSGYEAETTAEWSPSVVSLKATDYWRAALRASLYLPLWDLPGEWQTFSGLIALRADAQYTGGGQVPLTRLDATKVRGYDPTFDARALTVGSAELRVRLPALGTWMPGLWKARELVPVGFVFVDAGTYSGFADAARGSGRSGLLAGTGVGGGLEIARLATPTLTLGVPLLAVKPSLWWDLSFHLAF